MSDLAICVQGVSKCYHIYNTPHERLKQFVLPRLQRMAGQLPQQYFREFWALKDVSFEAKQGETVGIIGRNGSGKSTLLQIIAGTVSPTSGDVHTNGTLAALLELGAGFNMDFTGRENVYLNASVLGFSRDDIDARFDRIAGFADIGEHLDQPVKTYSSGMYVRLAFAVQACVEPQILIVDEALSVGDEKFQRKCFDYIDQLRSDGCAILLVTHSTATIEKFCQRAVLLHKGAVHGVGSAKEIVDHYHALLYSDEQAYLRYLNAQEAKKELVTSGAEFSELRRSSESVPALPSQGLSTTESRGLRAIIKSWETLNQAEEPCEVFRSGDHATIRFSVDVFEPIQEIQAGLLIRTVEGVSAFGTSTLYHKKNFCDAKSGTLLEIDFELHLALCSGTYFVTLSIAEAISHGDMTYLDKKTDVVILKVSEAQILGSGIAALQSSVFIHEVRNA